jgi:hypothetical protein
VDGTVVVVSGMDGTVVDGTVDDAATVDAFIDGSRACPPGAGATWNGTRRAAFSASRRALSKGTRSLRWRGIKGVISSAALIG